MKTKSYLFAAASVAIVVGLAGCEIPMKVTGGGSLEPNDLGTRVTFSITANDCDNNGNVDSYYFGCPLGSVKGKVSYNDKDLGVKLIADVLEIACVYEPEPNTTGSCFWNGEEAIYVAVLKYHSTNPQIPGEGIAEIGVINDGEGNNTVDDGDEFGIDILSGPFVGYENRGLVQGNIQTHECNNNNIPNSVCPCNNGFATPLFSAFLEDVTGNCIDDEDNAVYIRGAEGRVGATDIAVDGLGGCGYFGEPSSQTLEPITIGEGLACMNLLRDVAADAELPTCPVEP